MGGVTRPSAERRRQLKEANSLGPLSVVDREREDWARWHRLRGPMPSLGAGFAMAGACAVVATYNVAEDRIWQWVFDPPPSATLRFISRHLAAGGKL